MARGGKRFLCKCALLMAAVACVAAVSVAVYHVDSYPYATYDKQARIRAITQPQIIIVGDSNVAMGVSARLIQEALGMPATNYGLHAGLGQIFPAESIKEIIGPGDIIVLAPCEYERNFCNLVLEWSATTDPLSALLDFRNPRYFERLRAYPSYLQATIAALLKGRGILPERETEPGFTQVFSRRSFDAYGDMAYPRRETLLKAGALPRAALQTYPGEELLSFWNDYAEYVHSKGATLYMSCPPILDHSIGIDLELAQQMLEEGLTFPVISKFRDYVFPYTDFYDLSLHLTDAGTVKRTEQLIEDLRAALDSYEL